MKLNQVQSDMLSFVKKASSSPCDLFMHVAGTHFSKFARYYSVRYCI